MTEHPPKPRPLTAAQAAENGAFLAALRRTGNARRAAAELGFHRSTFTKRRAKHPAFAAAWDQALALAAARLSGRKEGALRADARREADTGRLVRTRSGRVQLRRTPPTRLGRDAEQQFLAALAATANVRLAAAAAGFSHSAFYWRKRTHPGFAREFHLALETGYRRLEQALLESTLDPEAPFDTAWRRNDLPPIPPMSPAQAIALLHLHQKEVTDNVLPNPLRRRRGETEEMFSVRLWLIHAARVEAQREAYRRSERARAEGTAQPRAEEPVPPLPALDQVTGWSGASGREAHDPDGVLFGGWRITDWEG